MPLWWFKFCHKYGANDTVAFLSSEINGTLKYSPVIVVYLLPKECKFAWTGRDVIKTTKNPDSQKQRVKQLFSDWWGWSTNRIWEVSQQPPCYRQVRVTSGVLSHRTVISLSAIMCHGTNNSWKGGILCIF